jgi:hypothetical protein
MKRFFSILCFIIAVSMNAGSANAESLTDTGIREVLKGFASEAGRGLYRILFAPSPEIKKPGSETKRAAFTDGEWLVAIGKNGDDFRYYGVNLKTRDSITLGGAIVSANSQRQIYDWNNGDTRYRITSRSSDPQSIRLQVFEGKGKELLNRILHKRIFKNTERE